MYKILLVEDDNIIAKKIQDYLAQWDYEVKAVIDFRNVLADFAAFEPHCVLLDITLPFKNGYYWCSEIRKISNLPIMFVSSASDNMNIVMAMNMGADDFIAKPFDLNVLNAKMAALMRRAYSFGSSANVIENSGAVLNLNDATITYNGNTQELTKNEFRILQLLLENKGKVVSRDDIMLRLWNSDSFIDDNTLTVNMSRLRKRLEDMGLESWIKTKKGLGYELG